VGEDRRLRVWGSNKAPVTKLVYVSRNREPFYDFLHLVLVPDVKELFLCRCFVIIHWDTVSVSHSSGCKTFLFRTYWWSFAFPDFVKKGWGLFAWLSSSHYLRMLFRYRLKFGRWLSRLSVWIFSRHDACPRRHTDTILRIWLTENHVLKLRWIARLMHLCPSLRLSTFTLTPWRLGLSCLRLSHPFSFRLDLEITRLDADCYWRWGCRWFRWSMFGNCAGLRRVIRRRVVGDSGCGLHGHVVGLGGRLSVRSIVALVVPLKVRSGLDSWWVCANTAAVLFGDEHFKWHWTLLINFIFHSSKSNSFNSFVISTV